MDKNDEIKPLSIPYEPTSISFPVDKKAFNDFIVSLLGQPESTDGFVEGSFEIDFRKFETLNNLIDSKIDKLHLSSLLEFRARIFYEDDSSIRFHGIKEFVENNKKQHLACNGFIFTWSYLVTFGDKKYAEKQVIKIWSADHDSRRLKRLREDKFSLFGNDTIFNLQKRFVTTQA